MVNFLSKLLDIRGKRGYNISNLPLLGGVVVCFLALSEWLPTEFFFYRLLFGLKPALSMVVTRLERLCLF